MLVSAYIHISIHINQAYHSIHTPQEVDLDDLNDRCVCVCVFVCDSVRARVRVYAICRSVSECAICVYSVRCTNKAVSEHTLCLLGVFK